MREIVDQLSNAIDEIDNGRTLNAKEILRSVMRLLLKAEVPQISGKASKYTTYKIPIRNMTGGKFNEIGD